MTNQEFIDQIAVYIKKYAAIFGICVHSPIIAQAILESGWGKSKLAATYHNYFGLKCGTKWTGKSVNMNTQEEYEPGVLTTIADNFRVFDSMEEGVKGYFEFIQLSRYQNLKGITDPKTYLETIKADGYATSSAYVQNNMDLVEQYELTKYDNEKGDNMSDRQKPGNWLAQYKGIAEGSEQHKAILKVFNDSGLCTRYKMTVNDAWCATSVSAAFIASGLSNIFPCVECSCENMINLAISAGIWVENDAYVPDVGDVILYDWDDNGVGDCTGWSDHVGIVVSCDGSTIRVIEGNKSNTVGYRDIAVNGKCIRGFITPHYVAGGSTTPQPSGKKSVQEVAKEVYAGEWGNNPERKEALEKAGYDYQEVQDAVNALVNGSTPTPSKSVQDVAKEVINGQWGNNPDRQKKLEAAGYNYQEVQDAVNALVNGSTPTPSKSVQDVAKEVINGQWGNNPDRQKKLEAAGYNYQEVQDAVNALVNGSTPTPSKSVQDVAKEVINGQWGNNPDRQKKLEAAGYNYQEVQDAVNALVNGNAATDLTAIAKEVILGKWGNGQERIDRLKAAGYSPTAVQKRVNELV